MPPSFQTSSSPTAKLGFWSFLARELVHVGSNRQVVLLLLGIALLPALFALIQITSAWDPYGNLAHLPVGLVNLDAGTRFANERIDLGQELEKSLLEKKNFDFKIYPSAQAARFAVDRGEVYFAVIIPPGFSTQALQGRGEHPANLVLVSAEGNSYFASTIAKRFATTLSDSVNATLEEKRWIAVLHTSSGLAQLKQALGELRGGASQLLAGASTLHSGSQALAQGIAAASNGAAQLHQGAQTLSQGVGALTDGMNRLSNGIRTVVGRLPSEAQLDQLDSGSQHLADGASRLSHGLHELEGGSAQLASGSAQLKDGLGQLAQGSVMLAEKSQELSRGLAKLDALKLGGPNSPLSKGIAEAYTGSLALHQGAAAIAEKTAQAASGATSLNAGATRLSQGMSEADTASRELAAGAQQLGQGVQALVSGTRQLNSGMQSMAARLPGEGDLVRLSNGAQELSQKSGELSQGLNKLAAGSQQLSAGSGKLESGAERLSRGIELVYQKIPASSPLSGDARGLATSVVPRNENLHPVPNNGLATAPLFAGFSLWMGVLILSMFFNYSHLPETARGESQLAKVLVKLAPAALIAVAQALATGGIIAFLMRGAVANRFGFFLVLLLGALAFMAVAGAIMLLLGGAGRALVSLLLILQFVSAGGNFPIELSPPFFRLIHPWLPVTHLLEAMRATLFGSYAGDWFHPALTLLAFMVGGLVLATLAGRRWVYVKDEEYRLEPALLS